MLLQSISVKCWHHLSTLFCLAAASSVSASVFMWRAVIRHRTSTVLHPYSLPGITPLAKHSHDRPTFLPACPVSLTWLAPEKQRAAPSLPLWLSYCLLLSVNASPYLIPEIRNMMDRFLFSWFIKMLTMLKKLGLQMYKQIFVPVHVLLNYIRENLHHLHHLHQGGTCRLRSPHLKSVCVRIQYLTC